MILYRSIGIEEFKSLLNNEKILGKYDLSKEKQSTSNLKNVVCFFTDEYWWIDKKHTIGLKLDIPSNRLQFGIGTYYAPKIFAKTRVWSGRRGTETYKLREAYTPYYSIDDIIGVSINNIQNKDKIEKYLNIKNIKSFDIKNRLAEEQNNTAPPIKFKYYFKYNITETTKRVINILKKELRGYTDYISVNCLDITRIDFNINSDYKLNHVIIIKDNDLKYFIIDKNNSDNIIEYNIQLNSFKDFLINNIIRS